MFWFMWPLEEQKGDEALKPNSTGRRRKGSQMRRRRGSVWCFLLCAGPTGPCCGLTDAPASMRFDAVSSKALISSD